MRTMDGLLRDVRFAVRALLRTPILFAAAVLTLAAGIGLATGVFAVAYGVLLRPLPYRDADRLVTIFVARPGIPEARGGVQLEEVAEWRRRLRAFEHVAGYATNEFTLRGAGDPRTVRGTMVTEGFFETLGMGAAEGSTSAISAGGTAAALSSRLADSLGRSGAWRQRGITIGATDFSAAAVMAEDFAFPDGRTDVWIRAEAVPRVTLFSSSDQRRFTIIGRLAPGVSLEQAIDDARRVV
jgi:putative ABC transport system permease protein